MVLRKGIKLIEETAGTGHPVRRQGYCRIALRLSLSRGEIVPPGTYGSWLMDGGMHIHSDGFFEHTTYIHREALIPGIFYSLQGMCEGGYRKVRISPHLAYGERGLPGSVPPQAVLTAEIKVLQVVERYDELNLH